MASKKLIYNILLVFGLISAFPKWLNAQCASTVSSFPYFESFEVGNGGWSSSGSNDDWALGTPGKPVIRTAGDGLNSWITGGLTLSFYNFGERSWVESPCFDFSGLQFPEVSLMVFWETEYQYDGANLQYSIDGGSSWVNVGNANESGTCLSENWFNRSGINNLSGFVNPGSGWSGNVQPTSGSCRGGNGSGDWVTARHCVRELAGQPEVRFRVTFGSGTTCNDFDGFAFDAFQIRESSSAATAGVLFSCVNETTVQFSDADPSCNQSWSWDFGDGTSGSSSETVSGTSHTFLTPGTYTVTLETENACGASAVGTQEINVLRATSVTQAVSCAGGNDGSVSLEVLPSGLAHTTVWQLPVPVVGDSLLGLEEGVYDAIVSVSNGCSLEVSTGIETRPDGYVRPELGPDTFVCPDRPLQLGGGVFDQYLWSTGDDGPFVLISDSGVIALQVTNARGCTGTDTLHVRLDCLGEPLLPNAFTPNQDGINDAWSPVGPLERVIGWNIYDRWGNAILLNQGPYDRWDGKLSGKPAPTGTYVCLLRYLATDGSEQQKTGRVTLLY